jgi:hypothetical protein
LASQGQDLLDDDEKDDLALKVLIENLEMANEGSGRRFKVRKNAKILIENKLGVRGFSGTISVNIQCTPQRSSKDAFECNTPCFDGSCKKFVLMIQILLKKIMQLML